MAAAVSSSEPACCSVRADKSWLPLAISVEARRTDSEDSRMLTSTLAILSTNWLNDVAMAASSSLPWVSRRRVRSPSPDAMSRSASLTRPRRRSWRLTATVNSATATNTLSTVIRPAICSIAVTAWVASERSMAMARVHGVPSTLAAQSIWSAPSINTSARMLSEASFVSMPASMPLAISEAGFRARSALGWASNLPSPSIRKAKLLEMGRMAATFLVTVSRCMSVPTTAVG